VDVFFRVPLFFRADEDYGRRVAEGLGIDVSLMLAAAR